MKAYSRGAATILAIIVLITALAIGLRPEISRASANVPIYMDQGGALMHVGSGGVVKVESGGTLQTESGSTLTIGSGTTTNLPANTSIGTGLYPVGYASSGKAVVAGQTTTFTGTYTVTHGLSAITTVLVTQCADQVANAASVSAVISGTTVNIKSWKSDGTTAGSVGTKACYEVFGTP